MFVARLFDAVTDPIIGHYSDRGQANKGSRKPMIFLGGILLLPCSYFLFAPPVEVDATYFTFWYMAFYVASTMINIPYLAWANEFTVESRDKTLVFSLMALMGQGGGFIFYLLPLLPYFATTDITPEVMKVAVIVGVCLLVPGLLLALKRVPSGSRLVKPSAKSEAAKSNITALQHIQSVVVDFYYNKPFLLYVSAFMFLGIGVGMWFGMFFIFVDAYLKLGSVFAQISLWGMVCSALAIPVWYRLSLWLGKRLAWIAGMAILILVFFCTGFLEPGDSGYNALLLLNMLMFFGAGSMSVIALPMLCDVIDYGRLKDRVERSALYFSVYTLMTKMQIALGGALGMWIVSGFGFDVHASSHSGLPLLGLKISVSWGPVLFVLLAILFIMLMPLNEYRIGVVRRRLAVREK